MKSTRRIGAFFVVLMLLVGLLCPAALAAEESGMTFDADPYKTEKALEQTPNTFEAWVYFPKNMDPSTRGGVILGNFSGGGACINFEVHTGGAPRLYWVDKSGKVNDWMFRDVNVYTGKWTHVAVVRDVAAGEVRCYVNADLAQTIKTSEALTALNGIPFAVGGDLRPGNEQYFKGRIEAISVYADVRDEDELAEDKVYPDQDDEALLVAYDFAEFPARDGVLTDISGQGYDASRTVYWMEGKEPVTDYAYSFAVVGDTQVITQKHADKLACIYDWIVDNAEDKNIQLVMGLGDMTETSTAAEWQTVKDNVAKLDGVVPYSIVRGNHDSIATFTQTFPYADYADRLGGSYQGDMCNTWQELTVGEIKYLIFSLDFGAANAVLAWAGEVIAAHPEHNVIITTHAYLYQDGTTLDAHELCPPATNGGYNNGDHMWDKLVSKYENIVLVISGHHPYERVVVSQEQGVHGNTVTQMLVDPQGVDAYDGPTGLVAMLYFSEDGRRVQVEYYSTVREQFYIPENQFSFELAVVSAQAPSTEPSEPPVTEPEDDIPLPPEQGEDGKVPEQSDAPEYPPVEDEPQPGNGTLAAVLGAVCVVETVAIVILAILVIRKRKGA